MERPTNDDAGEDSQSGKDLLRLIACDRYILTQKYNALMSKMILEEEGDDNEPALASSNLRQHQDEIDDVRIQIHSSRFNHGLIVVVSVDSVLERQQSFRSFTLALVPLLETSDLAKEVLASLPNTAKLTQMDFLSIPETDSTTFTLFSTWLVTSPGSFLPIQEPSHLRNTSVNDAQLFKLYDLALYLRSIDLVYTVFDALINRFASRGQFFPATAVHLIYNANNIGSANVPIVEDNRLLRALVVDFFTRSTRNNVEMFNESRMVTDPAFYSDWARHMAMREASDRQKAKQDFTDTEIGFGTLNLDELKTKMKALWTFRVASDWPKLNHFSIRHLDDLHRDPGSYDPEVKEPKDVLFERFKDMTVSSDDDEERYEPGPSIGKRKASSMAADINECRRCYGTGKTPSRKMACSACDGTGRNTSKKRGPSEMTQSSKTGTSGAWPSTRHRRMLNRQPRMRSFATGIPGFSSDEETDDEKKIKRERDDTSSDEVDEHISFQVCTDDRSVFSLHLRSHSSCAFCFYSSFSSFWPPFLTRPDLNSFHHQLNHDQRKAHEI